MLTKEAGASAVATATATATTSTTNDSNIHISDRIHSSPPFRFPHQHYVYLVPGFCFSGGRPHRAFHRADCIRG